MADSSLIRIALYNPCLSDSDWVVGSFRAEEMCRALSGAGIEGIIASPSLIRTRKVADGFYAVPLPSNFICGVKKFVKIVRNGDYDIVQERPSNLGLLRSGHGIAASVDSDLPFVLELHNTGPLMNSVKRLPMHLVGLWASDLVLSYVNMKNCRRYGARVGKFVEVPNGYSRELLASVQGGERSQIDFDRITHGRQVLGYFGGLTRSKCVDTLLEVVEKLSGQDDICFVFAGAGELGNRIKELASIPSKNVVYLGVLDRVQTMQWMSRCRATFAMYDLEDSALGNPVKVTESLALGVPVILNEDTLVAEELKSLCILVKDCNPDEIVHRVIETIRSKHYMNTPEYMRNYSLESIVEKIILPAYRELLESR